MNHVRRDPTDPDVGTVEPTSTPLDFLTERDDHTDSWTRSDPADALIEPLNRYGWKVTLPGGSAHRLALAREHGAWVGWCDCKGYQYGDDGSPCAHLCAVRRAHWTAQELPNDPARLDTTGEPVHVPTVDALEDDDEDEEIDAPAPDEARADGGRPIIERPRDLRTEPRWTGR